jgi:hypothetical protein
VAGEHIGNVEYFPIKSIFVLQADAAVETVQRQ